MKRTEMDNIVENMARNRKKSQMRKNWKTTVQKNAI